RRWHLRRAGGRAQLLAQGCRQAVDGRECAPGRGAAGAAALQRQPSRALRAAARDLDPAADAPARRPGLPAPTGLSAVLAYHRRMDPLASSVPADEPLTVVVAAHDEAQSLPLLHPRIRAALDALDGLRTRVLYVDDGSVDDTWDVLQGIAASDPQVSLLRLSRNFGKEAALTAGLDRVEHGAAMILDADGQDPPELIGQFVELWR